MKDLAQELFDSSNIAVPQEQEADVTYDGRRNKKTKKAPIDTSAWFIPNDFSGSLETPKGFNPDEYTPYDVHLTPYNNWDKERAQNQSWGEQAGRSLSHLLVNLIPETIASFADAIDFQNVFQEDNEYGNALTKSLREWQKENHFGLPSGTEESPLYLENPGESFSLGDSAWWFQNAESLIQSASAFALAGAGAVSLAGKAIQGLGSTAKFISTLGEMSKLSAAEQAIAKKITQGTGALLLGKMESTQIATQVYDDTYKKYVDEFGEEYAKKKASNFASTTYNLNMLLTSVTNLTGAGILMKTPPLSRELLKKPNLWKTIGFESLQEGYEEMSNDVSQKAGETERLFGDYSLGKLAGEELTTAKGWESFMLGAIGGASQTALADIKPYKVPFGDKGDFEWTNHYKEKIKQFKAQEADIAEYDKMAKEKNIKTYSDAFDSIDDVVKNNKEYKEAQAAGDTEKMRAIADRSFGNQVYDAMKNGTLGLFEDTIKSYRANEEVMKSPELQKNVEEALETIKEMERVYLNEEGYLNHREIFNNKTSEILAKKRLKLISEELNKQKLEIEDTIKNVETAETTFFTYKDKDGNIVPVMYNLNEILKGNESNPNVTNPNSTNQKESQESYDALLTLIKATEAFPFAQAIVKKQKSLANHIENIKKGRKELTSEKTQEKLKNKAEEKKVDNFLKILKNVGKLFDKEYYKAKAAEMKAATEASKKTKETKKFMASPITEEKENTYNSNKAKEEEENQNEEQDNSEFIDNKDFHALPAMNRETNHNNEDRITGTTNEDNSWNRDDSISVFEYLLKKGINRDDFIGLAKEFRRLSGDKKFAKYYNNFVNWFNTFNPENAVSITYREYINGAELSEELFERLMNDQQALEQFFEEVNMQTSLKEILWSVNRTLNNETAGKSNLTNANQKSITAHNKFAYSARDFTRNLKGNTVKTENIDNKLIQKYAELSHPDKFGIGTKLIIKPATEYSEINETGEIETYESIKKRYGYDKASHYVPIGIYTTDGKLLAYLHNIDWVNSFNCAAEDINLEREMLIGIRQYILDKGVFETVIEDRNFGRVFTDVNNKEVITSKRILDEKIETAIAINGELVTKNNNIFEEDDNKTIVPVKIFNGRSYILAKIGKSNGKSVYLPIALNRTQIDKTKAATITNMIRLFIDQKNNEQQKEEIEKLISNKKAFSFSQITNLVSYLKQHIYYYTNTDGTTLKDYLKTQSVDKVAFEITPAGTIMFGRGTLNMIKNEEQIEPKIRYIDLRQKKDSKNEKNFYDLPQNEQKAILEAFQAALTKTFNKIDANSMSDEYGDITITNKKDGSYVVDGKKISYTDYIKSVTTTNVFPQKLEDGTYAYTHQAVITFRTPQELNYSQQNEDINQSYTESEVDFDSLNLDKTQANFSNFEDEFDDLDMQKNPAITEDTIKEEEDKIKNTNSEFATYEDAKEALKKCYN